jgi:cbb3-type cytochrome oxidase maturation protein
MAIIVVLISISLLIALGFLVSFIWNLKSGQYDDTYSPSVRMLFEDKPKTKKSNKNKDSEK